MGPPGHCPGAGWTGTLEPLGGRGGRYFLQAVLRRLEHHPAWQAETRMLHANPSSNCCQGLETGADHPASPAYVLAATPLQAAGLTSPKPGTPRDEGCFCINKILRGKKKIKFATFYWKKKKKPLIYVYSRSSGLAKPPASCLLDSHSSEFSDPLGAEAQVGPTVGGTG